MKPVILTCALLSLAAGWSTASAEPLRNIPESVRSRPAAGAPRYARAPESVPFGGGFIELLMTGRDPSRSMQPVRGHGVVYGAPEATDPFEAARVTPQRGRSAALSRDDELMPIMRETPGNFRRQVVDYDGRERPGTIVIDTPNKFLYLVEGGGRATRYGIGVGRPGFLWRGTKSVSMKREWPDWRPPAEMLKRRPDLPRYMEGGVDNPLGARALYLGSSLYRIHGTNEPHTIGQNVSSGCIRLINEDVVDLYGRVRVGARVVVL